MYENIIHKGVQGNDERNIARHGSSTESYKEVS